MYLVHRLEAIAFIENPESKPEVNHGDGIKENNRIDNLEWMTSSENTIDAYKNGLISDLKGINKGKNNGMARAIIQMDCSGNVIKIFDCMVDAVRELGINYGNICNACRGRYKTAGGFRWCYA